MGTFGFQEMQEEHGLSDEDIGELPMPHSARFAMENYFAEGRKNEKLYVGVADADGVRFLELTEF